VVLARAVSARKEVDVVEAIDDGFTFGSGATNGLRRPPPAGGIVLGPRLPARDPVGPWGFDKDLCPQDREDDALVGVPHHRAIACSANIPRPSSLPCYAAFGRGSEGCRCWAGPRCVFYQRMAPAGCGCWPARSIALRHRRTSWDACGPVPSPTGGRVALGLAILAGLALIDPGAFIRANTVLTTLPGGGLPSRKIRLHLATGESPESWRHRKSVAGEGTQPRASVLGVAWPGRAGLVARGIFSTYRMVGG